MIQFSDPGGEMTLMTEIPHAAPHLPTPNERSGADILVFDGKCHFCRGQVERFARWDWWARLAFMSLHDAEVYERFPELDQDELMQHMVLVDRRGRHHIGAGAMRYLSRHLPPLWLLAPLLHLPGSLPLWQWLYRQVARRRYLFGGRQECTDESCPVHFK
jgi:predicted DCC family thiol-disulfide oxidoreductase YuxK